MTLQTTKLLDNFHTTLDTSLLPGIIIGIQEEDNVSNIAPFGGCFRTLRNISAHEPDVLVRYLKDPSNHNYATHSISTSSAVSYVCVHHILAILYYMYCATSNRYYIMFASDLMKIMMPDYADKPRTFVFASVHSSSESVLLPTFSMLQDIAFISNGRLRYYNPKDCRQAEIYNSNQRLFWKLVIPDITEFVMSGLPVQDKALEMSVYKFILKILLLRDTDGKETYGGID